MMAQIYDYLIKSPNICIEKCEFDLFFVCSRLNNGWIDGKKYNNMHLAIELESNSEVKLSRQQYARL